VLERDGRSTPCPRSFTPGKDSVPIVWEAGWAPGPVWMGAENLAPPGFDPQTIQPVVSCYIDWAIPTHIIIIIIIIIIILTSSVLFNILYKQNFINFFNIIPWTVHLSYTWEAGWAPGPVWMGAENLAPPRFDPQTIQPVASHYINWAIPTHIIIIIILTSSVLFNILYKQNFINFFNIIPWTVHPSHTLLYNNTPVRFTISSPCNYEYSFWFCSRPDGGYILAEPRSWCFLINKLLCFHCIYCISEQNTVKHKQSWTQSSSNSKNLKWKLASASERGFRRERKWKK
jgi:hypothetical protein